MGSVISDISDRRFSSQRRHPVGNQPSARIRGFLGMELSGPDRSVLDSGDKPITAMFGPGDLAVAVLSEGSHSVAVDEVEALVLDTGEQLRAGGCLDGVPPHVGQAIRMQLLDPPGPDAAPFGPYPVLDADGEEHLMPDADRQRRAAT